MFVFNCKSSSLVSSVFLGALAFAAPALADEMDGVQCNRVLSLGPDVVQAGVYAQCLSIASRQDVARPQQIAQQPVTPTGPGTTGTPLSGPTATVTATAGGTLLAAADCAALTGSATARCTLVQGVIGHGVAPTLVDATIGGGSLLHADVLTSPNGHTSLLHADVAGSSGLLDLDVANGSLASINVGNPDPNAPDISASVASVQAEVDLGLDLGGLGGGLGGALGGLLQ